LVSGKFLALLAALLTSYVVLAAVLHLTAWITRGFGDAVEILPNGQPFVMTAAADLIPDLGWAWMAPVAALASAVALGLLAGSLVRTAAAALGTALGLLLLVDLARAVTREVGLTGWLPSDHLPSPLGDTSYPRNFLDLAQGVSNVQPPSLSQGNAVGLGWLVVLVCMSIYLVRRKSVP
jgi:hypothetical protein